MNYATLDRAGPAGAHPPEQHGRATCGTTASPAAASEVVVTYGRGGKLYDVRGRASCSRAGTCSFRTSCPDLPAAQKEALAYGVKAPLVYTSVALRTGRRSRSSGVSNVSAPAMYHDSRGAAEAVDLGDYKHARTPDEPIVLHMTRHAVRAGQAAEGAAPHRPRRSADDDRSRPSSATSAISSARMLGGGGFDPARDIDAITVNRWPHGYAYNYNSLYDPIEWVFTSSAERPCVMARQPFGRITIANSDAAASPHTDAAFLEANRAVGEVLERRAFPFLTTKPPTSSGPNQKRLK